MNLASDIPPPTSGVFVNPSIQAPVEQTSLSVVDPSIRRIVDSDAAPDRKRLESACRDFEALLTAQMLKSMRPTETEESSGLTLGGNNPLQDVFDWELARLLSERSPFGVARTLMKQLEQTYDGERLSPERLEGLINSAAREQGIDPRLIEAVIAVESNGKPDAVSDRGAKGLMQLMDRTAAQHGIRNPFDPEENIRGGAAHLRGLLDRYRGDTVLALAAYNAGAAAVDRYQGVPPYPETQDYVQRVMSRYKDKLIKHTPPSF